MTGLGILNRPLGLALAGGGALGAWQAGALETLERAGLVFDKVLGFSAGAMAGAGYAFGLTAKTVEFYRDVDQRRILRLSPRLSPLRLCSNSALWESLGHLADDDSARRGLKVPLTVMALRLKDLTTVYFRFTPNGAQGWDGPLAAKLVASCAIPVVFPPVRLDGDGKGSWHIDGAIAGRELMRMEGLEGCRDIVALEMVRPEEVRIRTWNPSLRFKLKGRGICRRQMDHAVDAALSRPDPPRIFRLTPSRMLDYSMLGFSGRNCGPAIGLGRDDAEGFLADPASCLAVPGAA